jgi:hypothetical protein
MLCFYERRSEDNVAGRKNAEPSVRNSIFIREESATKRKNAGPSVAMLSFY